MLHKLELLREWRIASLTHCTEKKNDISATDGNEEEKNMIAQNSFINVVDLVFNRYLYMYRDLCRGDGEAPDPIKFRLLLLQKVILMSVIYYVCPYHNIMY